jgi:hypothetical protein
MFFKASGVLVTDKIYVYNDYEVLRKIWALAKNSVQVSYNCRTGENGSIINVGV